MVAKERESMQKFIIALDTLMRDVTRGDFATNEDERKCIDYAINGLERFKELVEARVKMEFTKNMLFKEEGSQ